MKLPSRILLVATIVVSFQWSFIRAAETTVEYTLPITQQFGSDLTAIGQVPVGTPMRLAFTYDPLNTAAHSSAGPNEFYYFTSSVVRATFSIGDFSAEMKPAIQLSLSPLGYALPDWVIPGDQASFSASTLPAVVSSPYFAIQATFLWKPGTLDGFGPVMPDITPEVVDLWVVVHQSESVESRFHEVAYPNGVPLNPVPEPATYGVIAACLLGALAAIRARGRSSTLA